MAPLPTTHKKILSRIFEELKAEEIQTKNKMAFQDTCKNKWMRIKWEPNKIGKDVSRYLAMVEGLQ